MHNESMEMVQKGHPQSETLNTQSDVFKKSSSEISRLIVVYVLETQLY